MTPSIDLEATADLLDSYSAASFHIHHHNNNINNNNNNKNHHHHKDTTDLLMEAKEAQRIKTIDIMNARTELLRSNQLQHDTSSITTAVDSNSSNPEKLERDFHDACGPFEGPEKLLELWFAEEPTDVSTCRWHDSDARSDHFGLRSVPKHVWETMLDIVKCKVLSVIESSHVDAYLLSESSMFVFPHKLILKTCGTTTLLLGLEKLLTIAANALASLKTSASSAKLTSIRSNPSSDEEQHNDHASTAMSDSSFIHQRQLGSIVKHAFYSRKSFMFPERQKGPHRDWMLEVAVLDQFFDYGSAYTVGKMNGDHWLLWMGCEGALDAQHTTTNNAVVERPLALPAPCVEDQTLEILMTHLSSASCARFVFDDNLAHPTTAECFPFKQLTPADADAPCSLDKGHALGLALSNKLGLTHLLPQTQLDAFAFEPCGYSANAVMPRGGKNDNAGYWTIHVTPEEDSSYASFETNVALCSNAPNDNGQGNGNGNEQQSTLALPTSLPALVRRVVDIFEPGKLSITLFVSTADEEEEFQADKVGGKVPLTNEDILHALTLNGYKRTDRIAYEFERYNLVFVSFEKRHCL
ncbi:related to S-adenosylmethionine decarboxylase (spe-2) [Melanopsichium pennsylvanicum]|uniref:adenosylmethionine decarboxylase n=2 Tax=Melanopsichium pennsylvanicum TaxID=63383 RepID=A0AAJ5C3F4_9BASI|nr:related to S-adenosylmethionine decarboxylase (spe-2) [Melanopsichium pennsylvanicum 4]SNX82379.1 related to S-adenosylmethionine decarboxylase (spe-2) [Melanopsichium pennsylvanicum]